MGGTFSVPDAIDGPFVVVGDIHGEIGLLDRLLGRLLARPDCAGRWLVFVGDLIDRGANPAAVVARVLDLARRRGRVAACMGNHELAFLGATRLFDDAPERNWDYRYAGFYDCRPTCLSYVPGWADTDPSWPACLAGGPRDVDRHRAARRALFDRLRDALPADHRDFLLGLPWCVRHPDYLVVHAGLRPDVPFAAQLAALRARALTGSRPAWLCASDLIDAPLPPDCPVTVICGHTVVPRDAVVSAREPGRIRVDTGSGYPGAGTGLSAVLLPEREVVSACYEGD